MAGSGRVTDSALGVPAVPLRQLVTRYAGYRYLGFPPGLHRGLPSPSLTVVIALGPPTRLTEMPDARQPPGEFRTLASGLGTRAVGIGHDGDQYGVQLDLTPLGSRCLLGLPAGELAGVVVELPDLLGRDADELLHRMDVASGWRQRFAVLDEVLVRRLVHRTAVPQPTTPPLPAAPLRHAWEGLLASGGRLRIDEVAARIGWSRRHLSERFSREFGLSPKELARVVRFERSTRLLRDHFRQSGGCATLAEVAARSGFYDQAHLAREWVAMAGCPPSVWLASEELPSVQADVVDADDAVLL
ncbi:MAG TPA: helix-turn-helix domain-containing protein [Frankiaceae bacterium]|nr:helix-turn-helix domain-containing protein [Frankiaceae bacterium]